MEKSVLIILPISNYTVTLMAIQLFPTFCIKRVLQNIFKFYFIVIPKLVISSVICKTECNFSQVFINKKYCKSFLIVVKCIIITLLLSLLILSLLLW